jgi:site-specific DNA recombinase
MANCIIYSRVSTLDQDNARQIAELKVYAKLNKLKVIQVFEEKISGTTTAAQRTEFKKLLELVDESKIDNILVWELSRLGRNMVDVINNIKYFTDRKINVYIYDKKLYTLDQDGSESITTKLITTIYAVIAEMEHKSIKARSKSGLRQKVSVGGAGGGVVKAFGFKNENKMLVIDEDEAKVVQLIYQKYLEGLGTSAIATFLNGKKILTKYNKVHKGKTVKTKFGYEKKAETYKWVDGTVYSILNNSIYHGDRKYKGEVFKVMPIVSKETFDLCQAKLKSNFNKPSSAKKYDNVLQGLLICPRCGKNYFMHKRADNSDNAYKCISIRYRERCGNPSVNIDKLNQALYLMCQPLIHNDSVKQKTDSLKVSTENKEIQIKNVEGLIDEVNKKMKRLLEHSLAGDITKSEFTSRKEKLDLELEKLNERLSKEKVELNSIKKLAKSTGEKYDFSVFKKYIRDAVSSIKIYEVVKQSRFKEMFGASNDLATLIEVNSNLMVKGPTPEQVRYHFILTRYGKEIGIAQFEKDYVTDYEKEINAGRYFLDSTIPLTAEPLKMLTNQFFERK